MDNTNLINQIRSEWKLISAPLNEANDRYLNDLQNLILKHSSSTANFENDYDHTWQCMKETYLDLSAEDFLHKVDVLEEMLRSHIDDLEYPID